MKDIRALFSVKRPTFEVAVSFKRFVDFLKVDLFLHDISLFDFLLLDLGLHLRQSRFEFLELHQCGCWNLKEKCGTRSSLSSLL